MRPDRWGSRHWNSERPWAVHGGGGTVSTTAGSTTDCRGAKGRRRTDGGADEEELVEVDTIARLVVDHHEGLYDRQGNLKTAKKREGDQRNAQEHGDHTHTHTHTHRR